MKGEVSSGMAAEELEDQGFRKKGMWNHVVFGFFLRVVAVQ